MKTIALSAALLALAPGVALAQNAPSETWRADAARLLDEAYPADGPGAAVIVTHGGETVFAAGQGLADLETGREITPDTVFRLGSITKQFAAALILQLAEEGALSLDDTVSDHLPDFPEPGASATVRQLLNHTVGIQSYTNIPGWMVEENTNRPYTTDEMIAVFADLPAPSAPGEAWAYNNSGYVLVGAVIEAVTGKPWHEAVAERFAEPLGLDTLRYGEEEDEIAAMAEGYTRGEDGVRPAQRIHMSVPHAAGALVGSVEDVAAWSHALHGGEIIGEVSYAQMIAPTELPGGEVVDYGFGIAPTEVRGRDAVGHGGGIFGFSTDSIYVPEADLFVAVFANSDSPQTGPGVMMRRLAGLALGDPYPSFEAADIPAEAFEAMFGVYTIEGEAGTRQFFARDGQLYTLRSGGSRSEVFPADGDRFFYGPDSLTWFRIERAGDGAHVMLMHQSGAVEAERAVRTGPVPDEPETVDVAWETLERYLGQYALGGAVVTIAPGEDGSLTTQLTGQPALPIRALSETEFSVEGVDARIVFTLEDGRVPALTIHQAGREMRAEHME
ncbi:class A beta-lactamase-related serine hydrolase [Marinicauda algicola]|uniref:Class A beta-lactamase-related serine hydrolase n=1 Tax=Marinicauda algicola TaxID=2029849 RepID=A0A4S2GZ54_9PROT|nr:serine hydrolase domain-containing protein [Marinicauda algicola]TGY88102.1 class A beta-lactamase-related serine hydrolase [Marinicauda algicola]